MAPPQQLVLAASSADAGVAAWDLRTGAEAIRHRTCASRPRSLAVVADRFLAAAQAPAGNSAPIHYYHWDKPQVAVKSFPVEPIRALIADPEGSYLIGGGVSGDIFFWEVASGELLVQWHAHYRAVRMLDEQSRLEAKTQHIYSLNQHALPVTDVACFHGANAVSSSEDRTCKIWSLSEGRMLRSILFPAIIDSIALDPRSHIFYAGGRDGKIYVTAMGVEVTSPSSDDSSIIGALDDHSKAVTSLASSTDGLVLISGSEDGNVRVWDTRSQQVIRKFKHSQGPVTNVLLVTPKRVNLPSLQSLRKVSSANGESESRAVIVPQPENDVHIAGNSSSNFLECCLDALQPGGSSRLFESGASTLCGAPNQQGVEWRSKYLELQDLFVREVLDQMPSSKNT
ncbi:protein ROOT INITIATION DEFECTIVE 3-like isoform X2 [Oryza brachyantha]|uniref:protein ROOT INITIATION DEFECTIVE 3-like isoform X2 n=1 Tax=Oryza brachyantha TaxID=4533 RepID=UPI001ADA79C3|nr:protein ROOT INITIATION DEFECTIVE 3-like isoform X2 [Oryza brachyantha]